MSDQRRKFTIARVDDAPKPVNKPVEETKKFERERYVSSISGYNVKDTYDFPYVRYGNGGYQYEGLKDKSERTKEYNADMERNDFETSRRNRIPSYLMREDYSPQKRSVASYPANERTHIPAPQKVETPSKVGVKVEEVRPVEAKVEEKPIQPRIEERPVQPQIEERPIQQRVEERPVQRRAIDEYVPDPTKPKSQLVRGPRIVDNTQTVSFEQTRNYFSHREQEINERKQREQLERNDYSYKQEESNDNIKYQSEFTFKSKPGPSSPIPETRPVYSTPDTPEVEDLFADIQLVMVDDEEEEKEELTPYQSTPSQVKKESPKVEEKPNVYEVPNTRGNERVLTSRRRRKYIPPKLDFLNRSAAVKQSDNTGVQNQRQIIDDTLVEFGIGGHVVNFDKGPTVTRFEIKLDPGVKIEKIKSIQKNLQMNLESKTFRMQAPIPGKSTIGIEVPNRQTDIVYFGELLSNREFLHDGNPLNVVLGSDVTGRPTYLDISTMPHGLIAGTSGSGKSVCINSIIMSILYKATPEEVKMILVDPKLIEFTNYEDMPHLATPVISDPKLAAEALSWAVDEMQRRYELFKSCRCRDFTSYNAMVKDNPSLSSIPYVVIIIDELNDLMMSSAKTVEESITRLAQKARAAGIHLILATQRPTTDVISGTIKANIAVRIAFAVAQGNDSRTILDHNGAENLLGKGDMLYFDGVSEQRVQGAFVSNDEIVRVTEDIKDRYTPDYMFTKEDLKKRVEDLENGSGEDARFDDYFEPIANWVVENNSASINRIQKTFNISFNRAQAIIETLESMGVVSENLGTRQRQVLVTIDELEEILAEN